MFGDESCMKLFMMERWTVWCAFWHFLTTDKGFAARFVFLTFLLYIYNLTVLGDRHVGRLFSQPARAHEALCDASVNPPHARVTYHRQQLLSLQLHAPEPAPALCYTLRCYGIHGKLPCVFRKRKRRPYRGGRRRLQPGRPVPVILTSYGQGLLPARPCYIRSPPSPHIHPSKRQSAVNVDNLIYVSRVASLPNQKPHGLKVATFNAQSVGANCDEKRTEISSFILDHDLDMMFLVETWLKARGDEAVCADLTPSGYAVKSLPRPAGRGGGLAVVYRDSLAPHLTFKSSFSFDHPSFELLQVTLTSSHKVLHFMCLYRPWPTSKNKLTEVMFF